MHRPLVDIDANARQPAMPSSRLPAKTQSRTTPTSAGRRSPFRVSASGSPRYMAPISKPMSGLSPAVGSKIPRKAGSATLARRSPMGAGAASADGTLPTTSRRISSKVAPAVSSRLMKPARSPPLNRDKSLPSPPIAQYVNPLSPPKAQRTLVDAEVAGTPTSEDWPILPAENTSVRDSSPLPVSASSSVYSEDENTEEFVQREDHASSSNDAGRPATAPPGHDYERALSPFVASSPSVNALTPLLYTVHAVTTASDEALESPFARKVAVPPRISSKRTSLPIRSRQQQQPVTTAAHVATFRRQQKKPGHTKWPLLGMRGGKFSPATSSPLVQKSDGAEDGETLREFLSSSPFTNTPPQNQENDSGNRVKRLSGRSTGSLGPVLTIADDADLVLLGQGDQKSTGPSTGGVGSGAATQERSLSALAGRISRQTMSRVSGSVSSRSSTPQPVEKANQGEPPVKIYPIRGMRPPRRDDVDSKTRSASSPLPRKSAFGNNDAKSRLSLTNSKRNSLASSSQIATRQGVKSTERGCSSPRDSVVRVEEANESDDSIKVSAPKSIPSKAVQVLGINANGSDERPSSPALPRASNKGSVSEPKKSTAGGETDPKVIKAAHRNSGYMPLNDDSPGSRSTKSPQDARGDRKISPNSTKSGTTWNSLVGQSATVSKSHEPRKSATKKSPVQPRSETELSLKGKVSNDSGRQKDVDANDKASKVKAKRSFRNFFHKRDGKRAEKMPKPADKRSSLTMPVNSLAKRFRHSVNLADAPSTASVSEASVRPKSETKAQTAGEHVREGKSSGAPGKAPPATCSDPSVIINKIANSVSSLPDHSPDRLRGLEIAETLLNAVDAHKQARISAAKAKKHARDAELNAERAGVELERMQKLCEPDFDHETMQAIKNLMRCAGVVGQEEQRGPSAATISAQ